MITRTEDKLANFTANNKTFRRNTYWLHSSNIERAGTYCLPSTEQKTSLHNPERSLRAS